MDWKGGMGGLALIIIIQNNYNALMKAKELRDILIQQAAYWGEYHNHKETMAWYATALQLGLYVAIILLVLDKAATLTFVTCVALTIVVFLTCRISLLHVKNQLNAKSIGADFAAACVRLSFYDDVELNGILRDKNKIDPLKKLGRWEKVSPPCKSDHPFVPKFIFDESEIQRTLDTKVKGKGNDSDGSVSSWSHLKNIIFQSSNLTIRQKTESYYYATLEIFALVSVLSIWTLYLLHMLSPCSVLFVEDIPLPAMIKTKLKFLTSP